MFDNPKLSEQEGGKFRIIVESNPGIAPRLAPIMEAADRIVDRNDEQRYCSHRGCTNTAYRRGGVCERYSNHIIPARAKSVGRSHEGCTKQVKSTGKCRERRVKSDVVALVEVRVLPPITEEYKPSSVESTNDYLRQP